MLEICILSAGAHVAYGKPPLAGMYDFQFSEYMSAVRCLPVSNHDTDVRNISADLPRI